MIDVWRSETEKEFLDRQRAPKHALACPAPVLAWQLLSRAVETRQRRLRRAELRPIVWWLGALAVSLRQAFFRALNFRAWRQ